MILIRQLKRIRNEYLRRVVYRKYEIGKRFHAGARVRIWAKNTLKIGNNFYIGRDSFIESDAIIGNNVICGNKVAFIGRYDHHYQQIGTPIRLASAIRDEDYSWKGLNDITVVENDVWVGYGATLLGGVKIGEGSIIAACSLVTNHVEHYSIYGGVPAKKIRNRFDSIKDLEEHLKVVGSKYQKKNLQEKQ